MRGLEDQFPRGRCWWVSVCVGRWEWGGGWLASWPLERGLVPGEEVWYGKDEIGVGWTGKEILVWVGLLLFLVEKGAVELMMLDGLRCWG